MAAIGWESTHAASTLDMMLDRVIRPSVPLPRGSLPAFHVFGAIGIVISLLAALALAAHQGLALIPFLVIVPGALLTFLAVAMFTKIVAGEERLIFYHHELAIILVTALIVRLLGQPVLPYLDVTILSLGLFLVFGRIGCLMAGCCHGRPAGWGVLYGADHSAAGCSVHYRNVRLFPVQAVESLWVLVIVIGGTALLVRGEAPGSALASCVVAYGIGRFCLEFLRGDAARRYLLGFSEAQWTSVLLITLAAWEEWAGRLPLHAWHLAAAGCLLLTMVAAAVYIRRSTTYALRHPKHMREIASALDLLAQQEWAAGDPHIAGEPGDIHVAQTSCGVRISRSIHHTSDGVTYHYTLSSQHGTLTTEMVEALAKILIVLRHPRATPAWIQASGNIVHLVFAAS